MYALVCAVVLDRLLSDPPNWPHPIRFIGGMIRFIEKHIRKNMTHLYLGGWILLFSSIACVAIPVFFMLRLIPSPFLFLIEVYFFYAFLATQCLAEEGIKMKKVIECGSLEDSRTQISYLVGRDTQTLDKEDITKATIETVAENTIDASIAPLFYAAIGILTGTSFLWMAIYKVINTLDSMVGYIQEPYTEIGYASAKVDDAVNYIPARLGAVLMLVAGACRRLDYRQAWLVLKRDCRNHKSPNCGFPEAVVAGFLGIRLGGTHEYFGQKLYKPTIGDDRRKSCFEDIQITVDILKGSQFLFIIFIFAIYVISNR